jgi:DNA polymerase-4
MAGEPPSSSAGSPVVRTILHVDMDAFYASVEQLRRPELRGRPVVVGGSGRRGVVAAASYEARAYGVRSAMPSLRAKALCPHAAFIPGDHAHYAEVSGQVMAILRDVTPLVEPLSLDEAFLDVTGARRLHGDGPTIAAAIRRRVLEEEGLTCSVGVATSKFLAKLATEQAKPRASRRGPIAGTGVAVVAPGEERAFLRPLPVEALWGVGPRTLERLHALGVRTVGQLERLPVEQLVRAVGEAHGRHLHALAHAVDPRPVEPDQRPKSISHEETFVEDLDTHRALHVELVRMADAVSRRARAHDLAGRTVSIKVRFGDFTTITRSATLPQPVDTGPAIARSAGALLDGVDVAAGVRLLGLGLSNLVEHAPHQLSLDDLAGAGGDASPVDTEAWTAVTEAIDAVRARFGDAAVVPAALAGRGPLRPKRAGDQQWGPTARPDGGPAPGPEVARDVPENGP